MIRKKNKVRLVFIITIIMLLAPFISVSVAQESTKLDINKASVEELQSIKGVGPVLAANIVEYRKNNAFKNIEEIKNVKGIGEKVFEKIKNYIKVESLD